MVCSFPSRVPLQAEILPVEFFKFLWLRPPGYAFERVIAKSAAMVLAGDDAIVLADHRLVVDTSGELTVRAVSVHIFSEQQSPRRLSEHFAGILYTIPAQIATRHFSESETDRGAEHELHHSKRQNGSLRQKRLRGFQSRSEQRIDRNAQNARQQRVQKTGRPSSPAEDSTAFVCA